MPLRLYVCSTESFNASYGEDYVLAADQLQAAAVFLGVNDRLARKHQRVDATPIEIRLVRFPLSDSPGQLESDAAYRVMAGRSGSGWLVRDVEDVVVIREETYSDRDVKRLIS